MNKEYQEIQSLIDNNKIEDLNKLLSKSWISKFLPNKDIQTYLDYYKSEINNHLNALIKMESEYPELKKLRNN